MVHACTQKTTTVQKIFTILLTHLSKQHIEKNGPALKWFRTGYGGLNRQKGKTKDFSADKKLEVSSLH